MNIISHRTIREYGESNNQAVTPLDDWYRKAKAIRPNNLTELQRTFPTADLVGNCVVFNIGGNNYRLISKIYFESNLLLVRFILTHSEYDKGKWKADC